MTTDSGSGVGEAVTATGGWLFHQLAARVAAGVALVRVENRKTEGQEEEESGQPARDFGEHIGRLRAENVFRHAAAEGCAQALAFWALHQDHEDHEQRDENVESEQDIDQNGHRDGQYRQSGRFVNGVSPERGDRLFEFRPCVCPYRPDSFTRSKSRPALQVHLAQFLAPRAQFVFDLIKPRDELVGRGLQHRFRIEIVFPREIDDGKEQIADLIRDRVLGSRDAMASFASASSSSTFAIRPEISVQSKLTRAAFFCAFCARIKAGSAAGRSAR